jgi:hypothetical protein
MLNVATVVEESQKRLDEEECDDNRAEGRVGVGVDLTLMCWSAESVHLKFNSTMAHGKSDW